MKKGGYLSQDVKACKAYLRSKGIPAGTIEQIQLAMINDAIRESDCMQYDRMFGGFALALARQTDFDTEKIVEILREFDKLCGYIGENDDGYDWSDCLKELRDRTGIVPRTDEENRVVFEYEPIEMMVGDDDEAAEVV